MKHPVCQACLEGKPRASVVFPAAVARCCFCDAVTGAGLAVELTAAEQGKLLCQGDHRVCQECHHRARERHHPECWRG